MINYILVVCFNDIFHENLAITFWSWMSMTIGQQWTIVSRFIIMICEEICRQQKNWLKNIEFLKKVYQPNISVKTCS